MSDSATPVSKPKPQSEPDRQAAINSMLDAYVKHEREVRSARAKRRQSAKD